MPILNKDALAKAVAEKTGTSFAEVTKIIDAVQETIISTVAAGQEVKLMGFLAIEPTVRAARVYKNPRTGEDMDTEETAGIRVRPMKNFRERVSAAAAK